MDKPVIVAIGIFAVLFAGSVAVLILGDESSTSLYGSK